MAIVKICPTCGFSNAPTSPFCSGCGVSLVSVAPSDPLEIRPPPNDTTQSNIVKVVCADCGKENKEGSDRCVYCDCALLPPRIQTAGYPKTELTWPWGKQNLTGPLRIGRDPPAEESLIKAISDLGYDNISRSHADLLFDAGRGRVSVIDLGSTNGTFIDGVRIPANKPIPLESGATVRFAANLAVIVKVVSD